MGGPGPAFFYGAGENDARSLMKSPRQIRDNLLKIVEPVCAGSGYELVDLRLVNEGAWVLRVFIDHAPGSVRAASGSIGFDDCESMSRELSAVLDVEDPIPQAYRLEVSSPGVDRPLRTADHFRRFTGERARVSLSNDLDGRKNFTGVLLGVDDSGDAPVIQLDVDGTQFQLPLDGIHTAKLIPDWDRLMSESN